MKVLVSAALMAVAVGACDPSIPASASRDIVTSIQDSLRYLQEDGDRWLEGKVWVQDGQGCVSCHHVGFALWSHREAQRAGVPFPPEGIDDLPRRGIDFLAQPGKTRLVSATQMIMAEAHSENDLEYIRSHSKPAGQWRARGQFPSQKRGEEESDDVASLWALAALVTLEPLDDDTKARRTRALEWLGGAETGVSNEWAAARLIVAVQRQEDEQIDALVDGLLATQNEDGGWSWLEGDPSNPFSTGQTVYALATVDDDRILDALRYGVDYLLANQQAQGTWKTPSRLTSTKASKKKDYIYQYWGTAWASMGLSRALARPR